MSAAPFYDSRPVAPSSRCPRCRQSVQVSRCRTAARECCGSCGHTWTPARTERWGVR